MIGTWIRRACLALALLLILVAPTQWSLPLGGYNLTLADALLALAVPLVVLSGTKPWRLPWTHGLFLFLLALSVALTGSHRSAIKEWMQMALYFGGGLLLFRAALEWTGARGQRLGTQLFIATGVLIVALATVQYWSGNYADPLEVRGSFTNRNVLGGYLCLLLPLAFAYVLGSYRWYWRLSAAVLVLGGLLVTLSGAAFFIVSLVMVLMAAYRGRLWGVLTAALLLAVFLGVFDKLPRFNNLEIFESISLYDSEGRPSRRYPEWQAASLMMMERPWVGMEPGAYQEHIGTFYGVIPRETGPTEPDIQNLYLVLAAASGIPACLAFVLMLAGAVAAALKRLLNRDTSEIRPLQGIDLGVAGGLIAFSLVALWHPLLVRGIGIPLALLLAVAHYGCLDSADSE